MRPRRTVSLEKNRTYEDVGRQSPVTAASRVVSSPPGGPAAKRSESDSAFGLSVSQQLRALSSLPLSQLSALPHTCAQAHTHTRLCYQQPGGNLASRALPRVGLTVIQLTALPWPPVHHMQTRHSSRLFPSLVRGPLALSSSRDADVFLHRVSRL